MWTRIFMFVTLIVLIRAQKAYENYFDKYPHQFYLGIVLESCDPTVYTEIVNFKGELIDVVNSRSNEICYVLKGPIQKFRTSEGIIVTVQGSLILFIDGEFWCSFDPRALVQNSIFLGDEEKKQFQAPPPEAKSPPPEAKSPPPQAKSPPSQAKPPPSQSFSDWFEAFFRSLPEWIQAASIISYIIIIAIIFLSFLLWVGLNQQNELPAPEVDLFVPEANLFVPEAEKSNIKILDPAQNKVGEKSSSSENNLCRICLDKERNILFKPCHHILTCADCSRTVRECPLCRKKIEKRVRIYLA